MSNNGANGTGGYGLGSGPGLELGSARIKVIGVGGGGTNAVNRMIEGELTGVEFVAMNTDAQALMKSSAQRKLQLGENSTRGLGAGGDPGKGRSAAEESKSEIKKLLDGSDMVFITAGMGGGTGTGAAPIIAEIAAEIGALTVAVVTKPFGFEGPRRQKLAEEGIKQLKDKVDTIIIVPNDRLLTVGDRRMTLREAFIKVDDVLRRGVQGISDIIAIPGVINVDFADVRAIMQDAGPALMGIGEATGDHRAVEASQEATSSPLLETSINGATRVLVNVTSGSDLTLAEFTEASEQIHALCDQEDANIIFGWVTDPTLEGQVRVTVLATGFANRESGSLPPFIKEAMPNREANAGTPAPTAPFRPHTHNAPANPPAPPANAAPAPQPVVRAEEPAPAPPPAVPAAQPAPEPRKLSGDELDIPAFLRKR